MLSLENTCRARGNWFHWQTKTYLSTSWESWTNNLSLTLSSILCHLYNPIRHLTWKRILPMKSMSLSFNKKISQYCGIRIRGKADHQSHPLNKKNDIMWNKTKFNTNDTNLDLSYFVLFLFYEIQLTLVSLIASGSKSSAVSRKQWGVHICQVMIKSILYWLLQAHFSTLNTKSHDF